eukprot:NODE_156_length_16689_cov_0.273960.p13 type:complete len:109 gc:universal NODE_156_length_16689_cov_0.273960:15792-16118(+)
MKKLSLSTNCWYFNIIISFGFNFDCVITVSMNLDIIVVCDVVSICAVLTHLPLSLPSLNSFAYFFSLLAKYARSLIGNSSFRPTRYPALFILHCKTYSTFRLKSKNSS